MKRRLLWSGAAVLALLQSCATDGGSVAGGGFETNDISVGVNIYLQDGKAADSVKVWLLLPSGDTAPAAVLDSAYTDSTGHVNFSIADGVRNFGFEAILRDSSQVGLAYAENGGAGYELRLKEAVRLRPSEVAVQIDSSAARKDSAARVFMRGSHFAYSSRDTNLIMVVPLDDSVHIGMDSGAGANHQMEYGRVDSTGFHPAGSDSAAGS